jgi:hypothetical protein
MVDLGLCAGDRFTTEITSRVAPEKQRPPKACQGDRGSWETDRSSSRLDIAKVSRLLVGVKRDIASLNIPALP